MELDVTTVKCPSCGFNLVVVDGKPNSTSCPKCRKPVQLSVWTWAEMNPETVGMQ